MLAAIGFFILPAKRQQGEGGDARRRSPTCARGCRRRCASSSSARFSAAAERIREGIAPYSRFIRAEGDQLKVVEQELREIGNELAGLRARVERIAA